MPSPARRLPKARRDRASVHRAGPRRRAGTTSVRRRRHEDRRSPPRPGSPSSGCQAHRHSVADLPADGQRVRRDTGHVRAVLDDFDRAMSLEGVQVHVLVAGPGLVRHAADPRRAVDNPDGRRQRPTPIEQSRCCRRAGADRANTIRRSRRLPRARARRSRGRNRRRRPRLAPRQPTTGHRPSRPRRNDLGCRKFPLRGRGQGGSAAARPPARQTATMIISRPSAGRQRSQDVVLHQEARAAVLADRTFEAQDASIIEERLRTEVRVDPVGEARNGGDGLPRRAAGCVWHHATAGRASGSGRRGGARPYGSHSWAR